MKTDQQLKSDVIAELTWDPAINVTGVGVAVKNGIVTVSGEVETYMQKHAVQRAIGRIGGVRGIALEMDVKLAPGHKRTDAEIAEAALAALRWHSMVPQDKVRVEVENGWVTLHGELDWAYQLTGAERAIRPLIGVRGVSNQLKIRQCETPQEIRNHIAAALARHAQREARRIQVEVDGAVVTLRGQVDSMAEHDAAIGTAFGTKGVTGVVDEIEVVA